MAILPFPWGTFRGETAEGGEVPLGEEGDFFKHICPPTFGGGPVDDIRNRGIPDGEILKIARNLLVGHELLLPAGHPVIAKIGRNRLPMWIIENPDADGLLKRNFPSPLVRTSQGQFVHARVGTKGNTHTIHWHGIEPTSMNDGVGKHSFEVAGNFVYQFQTNEAGTYFYHCHKNTTLHFEMGLFGLFIVDPMNALGIPGPIYPDGGPGAVRSAGLGFGEYDNTNKVLRYDKEAIWVVDDIDSRWHFPDPHHDHNMQKCDANDPAGPETFFRSDMNMDMFLLQDFRPDVFNITGVVSNPVSGTSPEVGGVITAADPQANTSLVAPIANVGEIILIRLLNASYSINEYTLNVPATVIATDGHPLGVDTPNEPLFHKYAKPFTIPALTPFRLTTARRYDLIVQATATDIEFRAKFYDWLYPNALKHTARVMIQTV